jgi:RNA polymerase-binding transcription factor DksA
VPAKWRWHYRTLLSLQNRLLRLHGESRRAAAEPLESHSLDEADSATDEFDHNLALAQLSAEQDALYEVDAALHRIADGTYGRCEESGEPIPAARLRAIPWTRFTRDVEERLERSGAMGRTRLREAVTLREGGRVWLAPEEEAEEAAETPPTPPNDETLSHTFSPPGQSAVPHPKVRLQQKAPKRKDPST